MNILLNNNEDQHVLTCSHSVEVKILWIGYVIIIYYSAGNELINQCIIVLTKLS